jgi:hypothetical protein
MTRPNSAQIGWDGKKKNWTIAIHVGAEIIKRPPGQSIDRNATDEVLRAAAVRTAQDDGIEIQPEDVGILR